jgi:receptor protein-tyrosine kinase
VNLEWAGRALARRWKVIVLCVVLAAGAAGLLSAAQEKEYVATATLLFRDPGFDSTLFGGISFNGDAPERTAATNIALINSPEIARRAERSLAGALTVRDILDGIDVTSAESADLATISATTTDRMLSARLANAVAEEFIRFRREADRQKVAQARQGLEEQLARIGGEGPPSARERDLENRVEQLQTLEVLQTGNAELVQRARPPGGAVSPRPRRSAILAGGLGLLIGFVLALLLERLDRRVRDVSEFERESDLPVLAAIPNVRSLASNEAATLAGADVEPFRLLSARLRYFNVDRELKSVLVTSPSPGDGKSTVAWELAAAAAESGIRVLLLEADLRRPTLAERRALEARPGLTECLTGADTARSIQTLPLGSASGGPERRLDVMTSGAIPPNPPELMQSRKMASLLEGFEAEYDLVVIDTPPASIVSDAIPLVRQVDGVVVVMRVDKSTRDELRHLIEQLQQLQESSVLGFVANAVPDAQAGYYGYAYEAAPRRGAGKLLSFGRAR